MAPVKVYFPGLNGVRFLAAFLVVVDHTEELKTHFGAASFWSNEYSAHLGACGVTIFFALSGFLITYLLLAECAAEGTIHVRHFYVRRVLRIWPLYYLLTTLGFFVFPFIELLQIPDYSSSVFEQLGMKLTLFIFMLPNVAFILLPNVPFANVLWSVGVEEQFYLLWPWLVRRLRRPVATALIAFFVVKVAVMLSGNGTAANFLYRTRFSCMLIGAAGAQVLWLGRDAHLRAIFAYTTQVVSGLAVLAIVVLRVRVPYPQSALMHEALAVLTTIFLLNISRNPRSLLKLDGRVLDYLGRLSYGIYIYHLIAIVLAVRLLMPVYVPSGPYFVAWSCLLHVLTLAGSVGLAHLSSELIEQRFLKLRGRFSVVLSGDLARDKQEPSEAAREVS